MTNNQNVVHQPENPTLCIAYLRVSTDDKGQTTEQQKEIIEGQGWQIKEAYDDIGTSATNTPPGAREVFNRAWGAAFANQIPLVMAWVSRFSRQGISKHFQAKANMDNSEVSIHFCDNPEGDELYEAILAWKANREVEDISHRVKAKIKADPSTKGGRPSKLTDDEKELILTMDREGKTIREITQELNRARGVHKIKTDKARKKAQVGKSTVGGFLKVSKNPKCPEKVNGQSRRELAANGTIDGHENL